MSVILTDKIQPRTTGIALTVVGDTNVSGALTCTNFTASGDVSIGGTLTYEDVTNIDSVGLITARTGVRVTAGGVVVTAGVSTFTDDVKVNSTLTATEGINVTAGVSTFAGNLSIADKIVHTGDTNTAIRFPSADTITAETGGSERARIDSSGRLLIGKTSGSFKLEVSGDESTMRLTNSGESGSGNENCKLVAGGSHYQNLVHVGSAISFRTYNGSSEGERWRIRSNGHLESNDTNLYLLRTGTTGDNDICFGDSADDDIGRIRYDHDDNSLQFSINAGERARIDSSGRLLLGTTTEGNESADELTVSNSGNTGITIRSTDSSNCSLFFSDATSGASEYTGYVQYVHSNNSLKFGTATTERLVINSDGQAIFKGDGTASQGSIGIEAGEPFIRLYDTNGTSNYRKWDIRNVGAGSYLQFRTINDANDTFATKMAIDVNGDVCIGGHTSASARLDVRTAVDGGTNLLMLQNDDASNYGQLTIELGKTDREVRFAGGYNNNFMTFYTQASGSSNERVRITDTGELLVNTTSSDSYKFKVSSAQKAAFLNHSGTGDDIAVKIRHARGGLSGYAGKAVSFCGNDDSEEGSIVIGTTSTAFNTSSDYRLKENQVVISDGITRLKQLKPYRFNFKKDPSVTVDGFFAHEVTPVVPQAVSGEKDAMSPETRYEEGDSIPSGKFVGDPKTYSTTEIDAQSVDYSKVVPLLTAALQEAIAKIETLETKVATLES